MYFQIELHVEVGGAIAEMSVGSIAFKKVKGRAAKTRSLFASKKYLGHIFQSSQVAGRIFAFSFIIIIRYVVRTSSLTLCMATSSPRRAN